MRPFVCLSVSLSVCLPMRPFVCLSVSLPMRPFVCLSVCLSACLSACPCVRLSVCLSACLSVSLSVCLPMRPFVCLSACPCVRLSVYLSACPCVRLSVSLSACPCVRWSVRLSIVLSVCLSLYFEWMNALCFISIYATFTMLITKIGGRRQEIPARFQETFPWGSPFHFLSIMRINVITTFHGKQLWLLGSKIIVIFLYSLQKRLTTATSPECRICSLEDSTLAPPDRQPRA